MKALRDLPSVKGKGEVVNHGKTTDMNLSNLFSLMISLANAKALPQSPAIVAGISQFSEHVMTSATIEPVQLISEMKRAYTWYIGLVRGDQLAHTHKYDFEFLNHVRYSRTQAAMIPLLSLQYSMFGTMQVTKESAWLIRVILALLSAHRVFSISADADYTTITAPYTGTANLEQLYKEIDKALHAMNITSESFKELLDGRTRNWTYRVSEKGGPNGPATRSCTADARAVVKDKTLTDNLTILASHIGMTKVVGTMTAMSMQDTSLGSTRAGDPIHGRIHEIFELGGKTRLVAIVDYWTQSIMDPIHRAIGDVLKSFAMDGVYDQNKSAKAVKEATSRSDARVYSFDLSAATDRVPTGPQVHIMSVLLGSVAAAQAWLGALVSRDFVTPADTTVRYATGQPMGALSSFSVFTLTHHILVQVAAGRASFPQPFTEYTIIGDDVAIFNSDVADQYEILMASLGVTINVAKSILHGEGLDPAGEIAKRVFVNGIELSSIPVKLLAKLPRFGKLAPVVQDFLLTRGGYNDDKSLFKFFAGAIDTESLETLLKLNSAPASVVGMITSLGPATPGLAVENWSPVTTLTDSDVAHGYVFTLICEQLKRVEHLLRQTDLLSELLINNVKPESELLEAASRLDGSHIAISRILMDRGSWDRRHPMIVASLEEVRRVGRLLSALRAGTTSLGRMAMLGLLDGLRNSIWDSAAQSEEERAQILYSVFLSSLSSLQRITSLPTVDASGVPIDQTLEFTIPLLSIGRSYTVYWKLGSGVFVNMIRTRVSTDMKDNNAKLDKVLRGITVLRSAPGKAVVRPSIAAKAPTNA